MSISPDINTDFSQFQDEQAFARRAEDFVDTLPPDSTCDCATGKSIFILERRVDRNREELDSVKKMLTENTDATTEILEIVTMGKGFFKVLGWIVSAIGALITIGGAIIGVAYWVKGGVK